jgi:peptidoglycan hydrolase-like amidase
MSHTLPDRASEPLLRVGIILAQDGRDAVHLRLPAEGYQTYGPGTLPEIAGQDRHLEVRSTGRNLAVRGAGPDNVILPSLCLSPTGETPLRPGAGVLIRDVPAGRGFHWEKAVDQSFPGSVEIMPGGRGLLVINAVPLEAYLAGVVTAEMSAACPAHLLKAQSIAARSWLLAMTEAKHANEPFERCNDDCCQRYQGTTNLTEAAIAAVAATRGQVLCDPDDRILDANYAKCCGGITESPVAVWGREKPGLRPVVDAPPGAPEQRFLPITEELLPEYLSGPWLHAAQAFCSPNVVPPAEIGRYLGRVDQPGDYFRWHVRQTRAELEQLLVERVPAARDLRTLRTLRVSARGVSGRANALELEWTDAHGRIGSATLDSEYEIRRVLHRRFLYSSAVMLRAERAAHGDLAAVVLDGAGWGHGVGMCQIGALGMALRGYDCGAICRHYYPEACVRSAYA